MKGGNRPGLNPINRKIFCSLAKFSVFRKFQQICHLVLLSKKNLIFDLKTILLSIHCNISYYKEQTQKLYNDTLSCYNEHNLINEDSSERLRRLKSSMPKPLRCMSCCHGPQHTSHCIIISIVRSNCNFLNNENVTKYIQVCRLFNEFLRSFRNFGSQSFSKFMLFTSQVTVCNSLV